MADSKITALAALTAADPANDMVPIVDVSDTSMAASGTTKRISINNILACSPSATLASATITGDLTVDTSTLKVDSANNRVGVNTASPAAALDVFGGNIRLVGGNIFQILNSANDSNVDISNNGGAGVASMLFKVAGSSAMTLNSTGLGVGVTPTVKLDVSGTATQIARFANNLSSTYVAWKDGTSDVGYVGSGASFISGLSRTDFGILSTGALVFGSNNARNMTLDASGNLLVGLTSANASGGVLQLKSGITFPATQVASSDANTLDDYKESTWTPTISAGSGTPTTVTINSAVYTKVGRIVVCTFDFSIVNKGTASSSLQFSLPVTSVTNTAFCGSFREDGSTGSMGMVIYSTGTTSGCLLYNNATPWVDGYRLKGTYTYFAA